MPLPVYAFLVRSMQPLCNVRGMVITESICDIVCTVLHTHVQKNFSVEYKCDVIERWLPRDTSLGDLTSVRCITVAVLGYGTISANHRIVLTRHV